MVPLALPISILIASVMVYGALSERYELTSFKSAGISLFRIMRPAIMIAICTALFSVISSNVLKPKAYLSFYQIFDNIRRATPAMSIDQGIFNYDFKGYALRVGKTLPDGKSIEDVLIYDQRDRRLLGLITAKRGVMYPSEDDQFFVMELYDGVQYSEIDRRDKKGRVDQDQFTRVHFKRFVKQFDMSAFGFGLSQTSMSRKQHELMNGFQMYEMIDSLDRQVQDRNRKARHFYADILPGNPQRIHEPKEQFVEAYTPTNEKGQTVQKSSKTNSVKTEKEGDLPVVVSNKSTSAAEDYYNERVGFRVPNHALDTMSSLIYTIDPAHQKNILFRARSNAQTLRERARGLKSGNSGTIYRRNRFELRLHQQLCWAAICIIFVFIGTSFGSLVRKGGFGIPLLVAIVFFVIFIFSNILGEQMMRSGSMNPIMGAWLPCFVLLPMALFFTRLAVKDSNIRFFSK